ncbi:lycopene cyclase domain-containing protein [Cellulomonas rhizosphaerae]|uniref:Lycopene cyclase domain-containing protein n=1 Tax=Cellulomonas rhizosphaerae TaxID=2293719 RepID=A0A413RMA8_9CELL|nr:lycopene cyclase domain-containing protein [Cellulomonas rhizosphaerae]RHA41621.1 lycopene cyclase domain-containing protein [Cellulomonas rhizosphaerae]
MTYLGLGLLFVAACLVVAVVTGLRRREPHFWSSIALTAVVLLVLTVVFDSLMVASDLFRYDEANLVGVRIWLTPVEDLAWPIAAALLLPSVWVLLGPSHRPADEAREVDRVR